jgi:hypothetical protein
MKVFMGSGSFLFKQHNLILLYTLILFIPLSLSAQFTKVTTGLPGVEEGTSAWGDYNNDGKLDILLTGSMDYGGSNNIARVYRNDGDSTFTDINAGLTGVYLSSGAWGDYDNDGDLDILLIGYSESGSNTPISRIYRNNGDNTFSDIDAGLTGVGNGSVAWGDYNNDGYLDILLTGDPKGAFISKIYRNNGNGTFTDINANLLGVDYSSVAWGDYDNDCDLDILLTGDPFYGHITKLYRNEGDDSFSEIATNLPDISASSVAWGDYDNDGDLDIVLSGYNGEYISRVYRNDGNGTFTDIEAGLPGAVTGSVAWGDYDNDGNLDILSSGRGSEGGDSFSRVYRNYGESIFGDIEAGLTNIEGSYVAWGDYDNDSDLDILQTGRNEICNTDLYRNDTTYQNPVPSAPTNLSISAADNYAYFQWDSATDTQTPSLGLNYVLRIGSTPGGCDIVNPMAKTDGVRLVPKMGYANSNCSWKIKASVLPGQFYWSVQAIDGAFAGSAFAEEQEYITHPNITLLTQLSIQFGHTVVMEESNFIEVKIKNTGLAPLIVDNLQFKNSPSQFSYNYPHLNYPILPGESDIILVKYMPTTIGGITDSLFIHSNAINTPVIRIRLSGIGDYVPPALPQNVSISMQGWNNYDARIEWDPVTTNTHGAAITPDYYFVYYNGSNLETGPFYFQGYTATTQFIHPGVGFGAEYMFYRVKAIKFYTRGEGVLEKLRFGMTEEEVFQVIKN